MGRMRPELNEVQIDQLKSRAEARFYRACRDQLPPDWLVLFSTPLIGTTASGRRHDGEADFVIFVPGSGMLVVEVKGGGVSYSPKDGKWWSIDGKGQRHEIKDPFRQTVAAKHALLNILRNDRRWPRLGVQRLITGHAVMLADIDDVERVNSPQSPREVLGSRADLVRISEWIQSVLRYWSSQDATAKPIGSQATGVIEAILCGPIEVRPLLATVLAAEEETRIRLTEQQARVLRALGARHRAAIAGGAGTGKTLLAIEKARELAAGGSRTLMVCYNRLLADYFKTWAVGCEHLLCMTFHQLCDWLVRQAGESSGRDLKREARSAYPGGDEFHVQMPYALAVATEIIADRFDAIVVDEGQDFREEYWLPVELLLRDSSASWLYVFYDQNQRLYRQTATFPIRDEPFVLSFNCRNTKSIHDCAYQYFSGDPTDPPPGNDGVSVGSITAPSIASQAERLHSAIVKLLQVERLRPNQACVLIAGMSKDEYYSQLATRPLPGGCEWKIEPPAVCSGIRVDTVRRFKGLEADVVFLWGLSGLRATDPELLYVGASRAKGRLILVGTSVDCAEAMGNVDGAKAPE